MCRKISYTFVLWAAALMVVHAYTKPKTLKCVVKFPSLFQYMHTWKTTLISCSELFQVHTYSPAASAGKFPSLVLLHFYALCNFSAKWPSFSASFSASFWASFCTVNSFKENYLHFILLTITSAHVSCIAWSAGNFPTLSIKFSNHYVIFPAKWPKMTLILYSKQFQLHVYSHACRAGKFPVPTVFSKVTLILHIYI